MKTNLKTISNKASKFVSQLGLKEECLKEVSESSACISVFDSPSEVIAALKSAGAYVKRSQYSAEAHFPFGGYISVEWSTGLHISDRVAEIYFRHDESLFEAAKIQAALQARGIKLTILDVSEWLYGTPTGFGALKKLTRLSRSIWVLRCTIKHYAVPE